jgi:hypothetical protein
MFHIVKGRIEDLVIDVEHIHICDYLADMGCWNRKVNQLP